MISDESDDLRWWPVDALPPDTDTVTAMEALAGHQGSSGWNRSAARNRAVSAARASGAQT